MNAASLRPWVQRLRGVVLGALVVALGACASGPTSGSASPTSAKARAEQRAMTRIAGWERQQKKHVAQIDEVSASGATCDDLCYHLGQVCTLARRICNLADDVSSARGAAACERASNRCQQTDARLPPECACGEAG